MMTNKEYRKLLEDADVVCDLCGATNENTCESCPLRKLCDRLGDNQRAAAEKCPYGDCIPEHMDECETCVNHA